MKGQHLFNSFLPGVTVVVLTTQPVWAGDVKANAVINTAASAVLTSTDSGVLLADETNWELLKAGDKSSPTFMILKEMNIASIKPLSNHSMGVILALSKTGALMGKIPDKDDGIFSLIPTTYTSTPLISPSFEKKDSNLVISSGENKNPGTKLLTISQIPKTATTAAKLLQQVEFCSQCSQEDAQGQILSQSVPSAGTTPATSGSDLNANPSLIQTGSPAGTSSVLPGSNFNPNPSLTQTANPVQTTNAPPPSYLNPNPNPLYFPTKPEEVRIQGTQPITLNQAIELARRNNETLQQSLLTLKRVKAQVRQAQASLFPNLSVQASIDRSLSAGSRLQAKLQERSLGSSVNPSPTTTFTGGPQLSWNLYTSGQREANIRQLEEQERYYELDVERTSEDLRLTVATDYYNLQQQDEQIRISQSAVANDQSSLRDALNRFTAGVGTRFDVLQAQVNLANDQQLLTTAISQEQIARRTLVNLLHLRQSVDLSAADPVQPAGLWNRTLEDTIVLAFQNRPELRQNLAQRNVYEQQRRQALSTLGPQISLSANYNLLDNFNDGIPVSDGYSVAVQASLLLFDGGAAQAQASQARSNIKIAESQFSQQRDQIRFDVEQYYSSLQSNLSNIQTSNVAVAEATESLRLARLRFNAGVGTQTDVLSAESALTQAQGNQVNAVLNYNRALANLERAVTTRGLQRGV